MLVYEQFWDTFPWQDFFPDISLTVNNIPDISLTCFKFPDITRFSRQVVVTLKYISDDRNLWLIYIWTTCKLWGKATTQTFWWSCNELRWKIEQKISRQWLVMSQLAPHTHTQTFTHPNSNQAFTKPNTPFTRWSWLDELARRALDKRSSCSRRAGLMSWLSGHLNGVILQTFTKLLVERSSCARRASSSSQLHRVNGV